MNKFRKYIWWITVLLVILIGLLNSSQNSRRSFSFEFDNFFNVIFYNNIELLLLLILGVIVSFLIYFVDKYKLKHGWKINRIIAIIFIAFTLLYSIKPIGYILYNRKHYNYCSKQESADRLIYETKNAKIFFRKIDLLKKIEDKLLRYYTDTSLYYNYKQELLLKKFLSNNKSDDYIIRDTFYYIPDTFATRLTFKEIWVNDTVRVIDESDLRNHFSKAMSYLIVDILKENEIMVYNKIEEKFEKYIYFRKWYYPLGTSGIDFYFPNDSILIEKTLIWGL